MLTVESLSIVKTFETLSSPGITVSRFRILPVARTITHLAFSPGNFGVAKIIIRTNVTTLAAITRIAVTDGLVGGLVQVATFCVAVAGGLYVRAGTGSARHLVGTEDGVAIVANFTTSTKFSDCVILAVNTRASVGVTRVGMPVTLTLLAVGEVPESGAALVTLAAVRVVVAVTLTSLLVTELVLGTLVVTITAAAALGAESVGGRGTRVTPTVHNQIFTLAPAVVGVAFLTD